MNLRGLITAVESVPPPPCEVYRCQFRDKCAAEKLACKAFQDYVDTGLAVKPTTLPSKRKYDLVLRGHDHPQMRGRHG